jgi:hypothetical protein
MKMKIYFTSEQLQMLNSALQEMKFKTASPLIAHINREIQARFDESIDKIEVLENDNGYQNEAI